MGQLLLPPWWSGRFAPPTSRKVPRRLRPRHEETTYSDGFEVVERDAHGRMVAHVVCRTSQPYLNEEYQYDVDGRRIVTSRDDVPVNEEEGADNNG